MFTQKLEVPFFDLMAISIETEESDGVSTTRSQGDGDREEQESDDAHADPWLQHGRTTSDEETAKSWSHVLGDDQAVRFRHVANKSKPK